MDRLRFALPFVIAGFAVLAWQYGRQGGRPTEPAGDEPEIPPPPAEMQVESIAPLQTLRDRTQGPGDRDDWRRLASSLQAAARKDRALLARLEAMLLDPAQPLHLRELAAFVLGSLDAPEARRALVRALELGGDATWLRVLALAAGSARDRNREGTFAHPPGGPYIHETPSGLSVEIRRVFPDAVLRLAVERLAGHADVEVRRTALQVLQHTLQSEGVALHDGKDADLGTLRGTYLNVLGGDADVSVRGEAAWGLANWLSVVPPEFAGQAAVADALIQAGLKEAEEPARFRSLAGLKQAELRPEQLSKMAEAAASPTEGFEVRSWAIEVLGSKGEDLSDAQRAGLVALSGDREGKLREVAVRSLAGLQGNEAAREAARKGLADPEWNVRAAAAATVAALEGKEARARLETLATSDPREEVRISAQRVLRALVGP